MSTLSRICLALAGFLAVAGGVYGVTSHEPAGTTLLLVAAVTFCFLGIVTRMAAHGSEGSELAGEDEVHIGPTIWPFGFAIAGVILAIGFIVSPWILVLGAAAFAVSAAGWLRDVTRSHAPAGGR
jgi:Cytochrome c oxidase subunit IV